MFLLLGSAWIVLQIATNPADQFVEEDSTNEEVKNSFAFTGLSDELVEVERYYISEVSLKESELSNYNVDEELLAELDFLKEEFEALRGEMEQSADPMKVVEAMINNYQFGNKLLFLKINPLMRVVAKKILREFWLKQTDSEQQLRTWYKEASKAKWTSPNDLKLEYPNASILKGSRVVFNICGNRYRLVVRINYSRQWVFIRFIGTHNDYDKIDVNTI